MEKVNINLTFDSADEAAQFLARASADQNMNKKIILSSFIRCLSGESLHIKIMLIKLVRAELDLGLYDAKLFVESLASFKDN